MQSLKKYKNNFKSTNSLNTTPLVEKYINT